jgi:hypothetical protein
MKVQVYTHCGQKTSIINLSNFKPRQNTPFIPQCRRISTLNHREKESELSFDEKLDGTNREVLGTDLGQQVI